MISKLLLGVPLYLWYGGTIYFFKDHEHDVLKFINPVDICLFVNPLLGHRLSMSDISCPIFVIC